MRIESVSVGAPRVVPWNGAEVVTSIFKSPVTGPVRVRRLNLDGDRQADLEVHGGEYKAIYAYAAENSDWWSGTLGRPLEPASSARPRTDRFSPKLAGSSGQLRRE